MTMHADGDVTMIGMVMNDCDDCDTLTTAQAAYGSNRNSKAVSRFKRTFLWFTL